jgi:NAD(P)-dependent dehydrogenase (short-subunit alcohol dehydrogenase family)
MVSNYTAAALTIFAFIPLLQSSPRKTPVKIVVLSSLPGSAGALAHLGSWASVWAGYSASKAAANMLFSGSWRLISPLTGRLASHARMAGR